MVVGAEVTREVMSRNEIRDARERYKILFDLSPLPKWIVDKETFKCLDVKS